MLKKQVRFLLMPRTRIPIPMGLVAKPLCQTAYYFCMLTQKQFLSLSDLFIIEKIGFYVSLTYEKETEK